MLPPGSEGRPTAAGGLVRAARKAWGAAGFVFRDLLPRYSGALSRPLRIASGLGEYRRRRELARDVAAGAPPDGLIRRGHQTLDEPLPTVAEMCSDACARLRHALDFQPKGNKAFFAQLLRPEDLALAGSFMRVAPDPGVLAKVAAYLGCAPYLEYVDLLYSRPVAGLSSSQLWHKDRTDRRLVKLVVYCRDVGHENGPFGFFEAPDSDRVPPLVRHYLRDASIASYIPLSREIRVLGKAGTTLLIDTSRCFHYGSRCVEPRLALFCYYSTGFSYKAREADWSSRFADAGNLAPLQRAAIGMI